MVAQIYLITPSSADLETFPAQLCAVLDQFSVAAVLIARHALTDARYRALCAALVPLIQQRQAAALIEDDSALALQTEADGVHVVDPLALPAAIKSMKPGAIVGAGGMRARDDAMAIGELDVDYIFFGGTTHPATVEEKDLATWWAQTFEVPAVLSTIPGDDDGGCEFIAFGEAIWAGAEPAEAMLARALEPKAA